MSFTIFYDKKNAFLGYKNKKFKSRSIEIFPNGLTNGFGPKMAFFHLFLRQYRLAKCLLRYSRTKKSRKINIFRQGFSPKMAIFQTFFFLGNVGLENVFYDIVQRKNAFLGYKNTKFKKSKN